jgi:hypothetical protein
MDLSKTIIAKSDQLNADDLLTGARTFTVAEVREGNEEQPVNIVLAEWPRSRPFKPSKTVQRILAYCWGAETDDWPKGARMTLFRDEKVKWAGEEVGGIRVSHLSHINGPQKIALQESKHKKSLHTIQPLPDAPAETPAPPEPTAEEVAACTDVDELKAMWKRSGKERREQIEARVADLNNEPTEGDQ